MKYCQTERAWNWELEERPEIEVIVAGDTTAPNPKRIQILQTVLHQLDVTQKKAENLLQPFIRENGALELTGIRLGQEADKLDCDFIMHFILLPAADPRKYDTYIDVCFHSNPELPNEGYKLHPFKFVVGFH